MAIISILSAIAIPSYIKSKNEATIAAVKLNLKEIKMILEAAKALGLLGIACLALAILKHMYALSRIRFYTR